MASIRRTADLWLTLFALALLVISPVENALGNNLPQMLPHPVGNHALPLFSALLGTIILVDLILVGLRHQLADGSGGDAKAAWRRCASGRRVSVGAAQPVPRRWLAAKISSTVIPPLHTN